MSLFSKNLRFLRKKGNHNQEEIAQLFNKQPNTVGNWENRKSEPGLQELIRLGEFFKVSTEDLLQRDLEQSPQGPAATLPEGMISLPAGSYNGAEYPTGLTSETGAEAFWLILRELRALHQKVDLLMADRESAGRKRNSDKSSH